MLAAAEAALARRVDLLGSGPVELGRPIDWLRDFKTGRRWAPGFAPRIAYVDWTDESDVKVPWELSRLQWLIPAGQAYVLTGEERYAAAVREVLEEWIEANPYGWTVNWSVAMEAAMRIFTWTWLFHACARSEAWRDEGFRFRFLRSLYLHADWVDRNLEWSDVRGNHYTADAAGLAVAGLFFGEGRKPRRWAERGWRLLCEEIRLQVSPDGVDFEASTAYHRLVCELFLLPALYRLRLGLDVPAEYRERLAGMARFTLAYTRPDGSAPAWGDEDDARALPLGGSPSRDHRYLPGLVGLAFGIDDLCFDLGAPRTEALWLLGAESAARLRPGRPEPRPAVFPDGGVVVLAGGADHVFVDCGPVGLAGRGGHGHNDCLSFEAVLDGVPIVVDPGTYVYTASPEWRNRFRSTAFHNTPLVEGEEQARIDTGSLWRIEPDATGEILDVELAGPRLRFRGAHRGYERLASPVRVTRTIELDRDAKILRVIDVLEGSGHHDVCVPLQLSIGARVEALGDGRATLVARGRRFSLAWAERDDWQLTVAEGWVSRAYGVREPAPRLEWRRRGDLRPLEVRLAPAEAGPAEPASSGGAAG